MFKFVVLMFMPICIFAYTLSFGRWLRGKGITGGAVGAYLIGILALVTSSITLWQMTM